MCSYEMGSVRASEVFGEQAAYEDSARSDLHVLRQDEKPVPSDTHVTGKTLPENSTVDVSGGGSVVSGDQAVVVDSSRARMQTKEDQSDADEPPQRHKKDEAYHGDGDALKGRQVQKKFGRKNYVGEVVKFDPETKWYKVVYEDDDQEELWWWELEPILVKAGTSPKAGYKTSHEAEQKTPVKRRRSVENDQVEQQIETDSPKRREAELSDQVEKLQQQKQKDIPAKRRKVEQNDQVERQEERDLSTGEVVYEEAEKKPGRKQGKKRKMDTAGMSSESKPVSEGTVAMSLRSRAPTEKETDALDLGLELIGALTRKKFGDRAYDGEIVGYDADVQYYKIRYEDGDEEELDWNELKPTLLAINEKHTPSSNGHAAEESPQEHKKSSKRGRKKGSKITTGIERRLQEEFSAVLPAPRDYGRFHPALEAVRFCSPTDADNLEFYAWGEVVSQDKAKCPELQALKVLPSSSPVVHLAASHHHLAALTAAGQVWVWRNKHGNICERCNEWEHIADLDTKSIVLLDIAGPDVDRASAGYSPKQEDQVPDPFYLAAVSYSGKDYIFHGSQPHEPVRTYSLVEEPRHLSLEQLLELHDAQVVDIGRIVQLSVGTVQYIDEPPYIGYITDAGRVYIRCASKDFIEEVYHVTGFTGQPLKIQCGSAYHAIIMTDNGCAWTWSRDAGCQPAHGALVDRKVVDVDCYGEDFIALTEEGEGHQWTYSGSNMPTTIFQNEDRLKKVAIGPGVTAGVSHTGKLHTWRTYGTHREYSFITVLGTKNIVKVLCAAGSLIAVGQKKPRAPKGGLLSD